MPLERLEKVRIIVNDEDEDDERASAPNRQHTHTQLSCKTNIAPIYAPWPTHNKDFGEDSFIAMVFVRIS